jgi:thiamine biosynthesis protein ThiS
MKIAVRLLGKLRNNLPAAKTGPTSARMTLDEGATPQVLIEKLGLKPGATYLVLINDENVPAGNYASQPIEEGDTVTICPPIQGG